MKAALLLIACMMLCASCSLDDFLANEKKLDHYTLSTAIIPESARTLVSFESDGNTLYGFWVVNAGRPDAQTTVLYCHGNRDNIEEYWNRVELIYTMGYRCLIFDYRGFGMSEGKPTAEGLYEDGRAALRYLRETQHVDSTHLVLYGYSLGNVIAIDLAASSVTPRCLIAEAPFASAEALFQTANPLDLPGNFVLENNVNNAERIRDIHTPYLQLHGADDAFVPWESNGRPVWENAPQPKQLILVPGAIHTDIPNVLGFATYDSLIVNFVVNSHR
jgi:alpha-beta hydrolase superfamily lysophospholipase